jgi:hypothetical protein
MSDEKVLTSKELKERFVKLATESNRAQQEAVKLNQMLASKQININHIQGAMQDTMELLETLIGQESVKAFLTELSKKEEKNNGDSPGSAESN